MGKSILSHENEKTLSPFSIKNIFHIFQNGLKAFLFWWGKLWKNVFLVKMQAKLCNLILKKCIADIFQKFSAFFRRATFKRTPEDRSTCIKSFPYVCVGTRNPRVLVEQTHRVSRRTAFYLQEKWADCQFWICFCYSTAVFVVQLRKKGINTWKLISL